MMSLFRHRTRRGRALRRPAFFPAALEALEGRALLAATGTAAGNPLLVQLSDPRVAFPLPIVASSDLTFESTPIPGLLKISGTPAALGALDATLGTQATVRWTAPLRTSVSIARSPNDPSFADGTLKNLDGPAGIKAPAAWDKSIGSTQVVMAGIDTGVALDHPDLYKNIWINQAEIPASRLANLADVDGDGKITFYDLADPRNQGPGKITDINGDGIISASDILAPMTKDAQGHDTGQGGWADGISQDGDANHVDDLVGWNFVTNTNRPFDDHGHGTHTAGTMAATGDNGTGVVGVNWVGQIMALKFIAANGNGEDLDGALAIRYAADHGAIVSNNSWGDTQFSPVIADAIAYARSKGHIFVAAAGNAGQNIDSPGTTFYPAADPSDNVVSVAASDTVSGGRAGFSNYGVTSVDLAAPGSPVYSTIPGGYGYMAGTSMAAPHVAGVIGLVAATHPGWTYTQIINQVLSTVTPDPGFAGLVKTGGIVNADAAIGTLNTTSATFIATDTATKGDWSTSYGADGRLIAAVPGATAQPTYGTLAVTGAGGDWTWANPTSDPRAALTAAAPGSSRAATCWYGFGSYTIDVNLSDGQAHTLALYALDWDRMGRAQKVEVVDASTGATLDSRSLTDFGGGTYLVWSVQGHVQVKVTLTAGINAVVSGVFLGGAASQPPTGSASFVGTDASTQGDWDASYGKDGYAIAGASPELAAPSYATVAVGGASTAVWADPSTDARALRKPSPATGRLAARWESSGSFTIDVTMNDASTHRLALYLLDYDGAGRTQRVDLIDPGTGATLDTRTVSSFGGGTYLVWNASGHVRVKVTATGAGTAVASGLFFGAPLNPPATSNSATFVATDTATKGDWSTSYGADGRLIAAVPGATAQPTYGTLAVTGAGGDWTWANPTSDPRAALTAAAPGSSRAATCWYGFGSYTIDVNLSDGQAHTLALYGLDWDALGRQQKVEVIDASTGLVLDTRSLSDFGGGTYLVWSVQGHVQVRVTLTSGINAVVSGVFLGGPTG